MIRAHSAGYAVRYPGQCSLLEAPMNKLILPCTIFFTVLIVGTIADNFGLQGSWKIGLLCLVAAAVQIVVSRFQRSQR